MFLYFFSPHKFLKPNHKDTRRKFSFFCFISTSMLFPLVLAHLSSPIFSVSHSVLRSLGVFHRSYHVYNRSCVLPRNTHWLGRPLFEMSSCFIPLWYLGPRLSFMLEIEKRGAIGVEYHPSPATSHPSRADMEHNISQQEVMVPRTVLEIFWWNLWIKNNAWHRK